MILDDIFADPTNTGDALRVSRDLLAIGDLDGAERVVRWALDFNPSNSRLLSSLADIAFRRCQHDVAIEFTERAIEAGPAGAYPAVPGRSRYGMSSSVSEDRQAELLPVPYFHVVFTLPPPIAAVAFQEFER